MIKRTWVRCFAVASGLSLAMGHPALLLRAAEPEGGVRTTAKEAGSQVSPLARDGVLGPGGTLEGRLLDRQGMAHAGLPVMLLQNGTEVASTTTDEAGRFSISGLRGGQYALATIDAVTPCRLWSEEAAPPSAQRVVQVYSGELIRGQMYRVRNFITNPIVVGAAIGTAVAVPLALHNREPSS